MPKKSIINAWFGMLFLVALTTLSEASTLPGDYQPVLVVAPQEPTANHPISVTLYYWFDTLHLYHPVSTTFKPNGNRITHNGNRITVELFPITVELFPNEVPYAPPPPPAAVSFMVWLDPLPEGSYQLDVVLKNYLTADATGIRGDFSYPTYPFTVAPKYEPVLVVAPQEPTSNERISVTAYYWSFYDFGKPVVKYNGNQITVDLFLLSPEVSILTPPSNIADSTFWLDPLPEGSYQLDVVLKNYLIDRIWSDFSYPTYPFTVTPPKNNDVVDVVEFYNTDLQHYFITAGTDEIAIIEAGGAGPGWQRNASGIRAYLPETGVPVGALPVYRFYGTPGKGPNSHFYTVDETEHTMVEQDAGWTYEGVAFYLFAPLNGQCATDQQAIYRVYNNRFAQNDSNHRYITDSNLYAQMQAQGWLPEGVVFCGAAQ